jgi:hypothetical protein
LFASDCDSDATEATSYSRAVSDNDSLLPQLLAQEIRIGNPEKKEIRIAREYLLYKGNIFQAFRYPCSLSSDL